MRPSAILRAEARLAAVLAQVEATEARLRSLEARLRAAEQRLARLEPGAESPNAPRRALVDYVVAAAGAAGVAPERIKGGETCAAVARPRMAAMALAVAETGASLPRVGRAFGGRDHTTVLHAVRRAADADMAEALHAVRAELDRRAAA